MSRNPIKNSPSEQLTALLRGFEIDDSFLKARATLAPVPIKLYDPPADGYKVAAVIALLVKKSSGWHLVYMERTSRHPDDKHAGQISFPGGKKEEEETILECAIRETLEEIGIGETDYELMGQLSSLYIPVSNFLVYPFLAVAKKELIYTPEEEEVENIIEVSLEHLMDANTLRHKDITIGARTLQQVPYFDLHGKTLWGATAMISSEILALLQALKQA